MSTIAKVFTVLNLVFALFLTGSMASILSNSEGWRNKYNAEVESHAKTLKTKTDELTAATGERDRFDQNNRMLTNQKADIESELQAAKATAEQRLSENNQLRNSVDAINTSVKSIQSELADVQGRNKALMEENDKFRTAMTSAEAEKLDAQNDRTRIEGDLKRANDDVAEKERQLVELSKERDNLRAQMDALVKLGVDVAKIIGNNVPEIVGKVSAVDPNGSFVVLSVGENEGVKVGYPFDVYRGGDYIGRVVVDDVLPDSSTARIRMKNKNGLEFKAMDNATTRL
jgi:hypothetical protein